MSENTNKSNAHAVVETTVGAIIIRKQDGVVQVLLTRRGFPPYQDHWCLPGGHIDWNEPARQAVIREVKEEVGLDFNPRFLFYWDEIIPKKAIHAIVLVYSGPGSGELQPQPGEVAEIGWFSFAEVDALTLAFQHNAVLERFRTEYR